MTGEISEASGSALDPVYRASEVIFGVLMAMSFIGSISVASDGREEIRTLLVAALGCNLAWGLVDGVMHLVSTKTQQRRNRALMARLRESRTSPAAVHCSPMNCHRRWPPVSAMTVSSCCASAWPAQLALRRGAISPGAMWVTQ